MKTVLLFCLVAGLTCAAQMAHYRKDGAAVLNDLKATPGATDPALTTSVLCRAAFHTTTARHVTESEKKAACKEYAQLSGCPGKGYEIDHLISIELGGSNDLSNLWPQPVDRPGVIGYHTKDVVENRAHRAVCSGQLTLQQAQQGIATDWYAFGRRYGWVER